MLCSVVSIGSIACLYHPWPAGQVIFLQESDLLCRLYYYTSYQSHLGHTSAGGGIYNFDVLVLWIWTFCEHFEASLTWTCFHIVLTNIQWDGILWIVSRLWRIFEYFEYFLTVANKLEQTTAENFWHKNAKFAIVSVSSTFPHCASETKILSCSMSTFNNLPSAAKSCLSYFCN